LLLDDAPEDGWQSVGGVNFGPVELELVSFSALLQNKNKLINQISNSKKSFLLFF
jgi:hypothetical protein